jgi:hypothetical protein
LTYPRTWKCGDVLPAWLEGERELTQFNQLLKFKNILNDFRDFVDINLDSNLHISIPPAVVKAKKYKGIGC